MALSGMLTSHVRLLVARNNKLAEMTILLLMPTMQTNDYWKRNPQKDNCLRWKRRNTNQKIDSKGSDTMKQILENLEEERN